MLNLTILASSACLPWVVGMVVIGSQSSTNGSVSMIIGMDSILRAEKMLVGIFCWSVRSSLFFFLSPSFSFHPPSPLLLSFSYGVFLKKYLKTWIFLSGLKGMQKIHSFIYSFHKYFLSTTRCARLCSRYWNAAGNKANKIPGCIELNPREGRQKKQDNLIEWIVCMMVITALAKGWKRKERREIVWRGCNVNRWSGDTWVKQVMNGGPGTIWGKKEEEKMLWGEHVQRGTARRPVAGVWRWRAVGNEVKKIMGCSRRTL